MSTSDGYIIGTTKIVDHGSPNQRFNLVILSEGYTENEIDNFQTESQNFVDKLYGTQPFDQVWDGINIYRVDVVSTDSGADDPISCRGSGSTVNTYFDATFCTDNLSYLLTANVSTALSVANDQVPEYHAVMMLVNTSKYGGSGGEIAIASTAPQAAEILIHEMGHTVFGLADEYDCTEYKDQDHYSGAEPCQPNITIDTNITTNKWKNLILPTTPMPTMPNPDCTQCNIQPSPVSKGTVGTFEGAGYFTFEGPSYYHCGLYRPEYDCKMRNLAASFCAVCQNRIVDTITPYR